MRNIETISGSHMTLVGVTSWDWVKRVPPVKNRVRVYWAVQIYMGCATHLRMRKVQMGAERGFPCKVWALSAAVAFRFEQGSAKFAYSLTRSRHNHVLYILLSHEQMYRMCLAPTCDMQSAQLVACLNR